MKAAVIYYSMSGNTGMAAERIAEATGADLIEIRPGKRYPDKGLKKFLWGGKSAVMGEKPKLEPYAFSADRYDRIIFGFPVWAGNITPPLRTFIAENAEGLKGKKTAAFACQSGSGAEKAFGRLEECLGTALDARLVLIDPKDRLRKENEELIRAFIRQISEENGVK